MFFVLNKKKISSYLISVGTVIMLFSMPLIANNNINNTIETSANAIIENKETEGKDNINGINCIENAEDIDSN